MIIRDSIESDAKAPISAIVQEV